METFLALPDIEPQIKPAQKEAFDTYFSKEWKYFLVSDFNYKAFEGLSVAMDHDGNMLSRAFFLKKKVLLEYQIGVLAS